MIIDFHTHIFSEAIRNNKEKYFPSEPEFKLLYSITGAKIAGAKELIQAMDEQGVDKSVVFSFPWKNPAAFKQENDYIMKTVQQYPKRLIGFCCFNPFCKDAVSETLRCLEGGLSGVGELAFYHSGIDNACIEALKPVMEICREKKVPVLIHTNEPVGHIYPGKAPMTCVQIYNFIKEFQNNTIVLAHWGGGIFFYYLLKKEVKELFKHVYFDTAASPFLYDPQIYRIALQIIGKDRILFGSDFPLLKPARYFKEIENTGISMDDQANILGGNAMKLLKALSMN